VAAFNEAVSAVFKTEGGYVNDKDDRGGETKFGISKRSFPNLDIATLTKVDAEKIYKERYWHPQLEKLEDQAVATKVFDMIVNMGQKPAVKLFQSSVNLLSNGERPVTVDGILGPGTITRANELDPAKLLHAIRENAAGHYRGIVKANETQRKFLKGWLKRAYE
jgi:lysozyme family protein